MTAKLGPTNQAADPAGAAGHDSRDVGRVNLTTGLVRDQPPGVPPTLDVDVDQSHSTDARAVDPAEQPPPRVAAEEVANHVPVALEGRRERVRTIFAKGIPAPARVPVGVAPVGAPAPVGIEVEIGGQLVTGAPVRPPAAQALRRIRKRRDIRSPPADRGGAVPVEVVTHRVELIEGRDCNQPVVVRVVVGPVRRPDLDHELLCHGRVRAAGIGRGHRDRHAARSDRRQREPRARNARRRHSSIRGRRAVRQGVAVGVLDALRQVHHRRPGAHVQRPVPQHPHQSRRLVRHPRDKRHRRAARRLAAIDDGHHLVGRRGAGRRVVVGEPEDAEIRHDALHLGAVVAGHRIGHVRRRRPRARIHGGPGQADALAGGRRRRQGRAGPQLVAELLPGRLPVPIDVHRQDRVLPGRPEVPGVVGRPVAVQVPVPRRVDPAVAGGRLQRRGGPAPAPGLVSRGARVPVAGGDGAIGRSLADQSADGRTRAAAHHAAGGIAGGDGPVVQPDQPADERSPPPGRWRSWRRWSRSSARPARRNTGALRRRRDRPARRPWRSWRRWRRGGCSRPARRRSRPPPRGRWRSCR